MVIWLNHIKKYKKKCLYIFLICSILCLTACSSNIKKREVSFKQLEYQNLLNDYTLYFNETMSLLSYAEIWNSNYDNKQLAVYIAQSLENYYTIASNRISEDLENISIWSTSYVDYLGYTQAYVNLYQEDVNTIKKSMKNGDLDAIFNTNFYKQTKIIAKESLQFAKDVQETQSKEKS